MAAPRPGIEATRQHPTGEQHACPQHVNERWDQSERRATQLAPWSDKDLALDQQMLGDPEMTRYLGGPESPEQIAQRHARKLRLPDSGAGRMFKIVLEATGEAGEAVGSVGYWENSWHGEDIYEIGWLVLTAFQGRGIASAATAQAIGQARADGKHRFLHAFPSVENGPSNGI
ncbi:MAG: GNAT family N-acetyltransferase, partial [Nitrososphaerota archaeon]